MLSKLDASIMAEAAKQRKRIADLEAKLAEKQRELDKVVADAIERASNSAISLGILSDKYERDLADALRLLYRSVLAYHRETHILDDFAVCGVPLCKEVRDRFPKEVANAN